ncbi:MAG: hypothetical protein WA840_19580 [Caulobacteraceae bacterium]
MLAALCGGVAFGLAAGTPQPAHAFLEDICLAQRTGGLRNCIEPASQCRTPRDTTNRACVVQAAQFALIPPGRSLIHADATYFIALALGYQADVAYWIAAYNEVSDYGQYKPIDQCGVQASSSNTGAPYISAAFNGFVRTNTTTDGPIYHYVLAFSPTGDGDDVHGAGGVQAVYPFHYPSPGYPLKIDDTYEGTLYNLRQWAMTPGGEPGLLCSGGFTTPNGSSNFSGDRCLSGVTFTGTVPVLEGSGAGVALTFPAGPKVLDNANGVVTSYPALASWLADKQRTIGVLWDDPQRPPVPVQIARIGLYLHSLQDTASHSTFCGDDAPSPPGGHDAGSYIAMPSSSGTMAFGTYCATGPHLAGHVQETGSNALPLRDFTALNITVGELIVFANTVAKPHGWIINPELLPPDLVGGRNALGETATDLQTRLVGQIVSGQAWTRGEVYAPGAVTKPLQQAQATARLRAMNAALMAYSDALRTRIGSGAHFTPFEEMPGNSSDPADARACFK